jgi:hypothetical protein
LTPMSLGKAGVMLGYWGTFPSGVESEQIHGNALLLANREDRISDGGYDEHINITCWEVTTDI